MWSDRNSQIHSYSEPYYSWLSDFLLVNQIDSTWCMCVYWDNSEQAISLSILNWFTAFQFRDPWIWISPQALLSKGSSKTVSSFCFPRYSIWCGHIFRTLASAFQELGVGQPVSCVADLTRGRLYQRWPLASLAAGHSPCPAFLANSHCRSQN